MGILLFIIAIFLFLIAVACLANCIFGAENERFGSLAFSVGAGFFSLLLLAASMVHFVPSGKVLIVRTFGEISDQRGEGLQLTFPWQTTESWNIRTQVIEPDTSCLNGVEKCMNAASLDVQDVYVQGVLNIFVNHEAIQDLARDIGTSYKDTIVLNRLNQVVKETTAKYKAEEIIASREMIRAEVTQRMSDELDQYSITVQDFLITNIDFNPEFKASVESKVVAEQNAARERNNVQVSKAQAEQQVEAAKGRAEVLRQEAQGQADANRLVAESLSQELIDWQTIQKLADDIDVMVVPDNGSFLFQLPQNGAAQ